MSASPDITLPYVTAAMRMQQHEIPAEALHSAHEKNATFRVGLLTFANGLRTQKDAGINRLRALENTPC